MFGFRRKAEVRVSFAHAADGAVFARATIPTANLPDSFSTATLVDVEDRKWRVVEAAPVDKEAFAKSGELALLVEEVRPDELHSLPTINERAGKMLRLDMPAGDMHVIAEDDWRQVELIASRFDAELAAELDAIRRLASYSMAGTGYADHYVRQRIPKPLSGLGLQLEELQTALGVEQRLIAVSLDAATNYFANTFAFRAAPGIVVWGERDEAKALGCICLDLDLAVSAPAVAASLATYCEMHDLYVVDWCRTLRLRTVAELQEYLRPPAE